MDDSLTVDLAQAINWYNDPDGDTPNLLAALYQAHRVLENAVRCFLQEQGCGVADDETLFVMLDQYRDQLNLTADERNRLHDFRLRRNDVAHGEDSVNASVLANHLNHIRTCFGRWGYNTLQVPHAYAVKRKWPSMSSFLAEGAIQEAVHQLPRLAKDWRRAHPRAKRVPLSIRYRLFVEARKAALEGRKDLWQTVLMQRIPTSRPYFAQAFIRTLREYDVDAELKLVFLRLADSDDFDAELERIKSEIEQADTEMNNLYLRLSLSSTEPR